MSLLQRLGIGLLFALKEKLGSPSSEILTEPPGLLHLTSQSGVSKGRQVLGVRRCARAATLLKQDGDLLLCMLHG